MVPLDGSAGLARPVRLVRLKGSRMRFPVISNTLPVMAKGAPCYFQLSPCSAITGRNAGNLLKINYKLSNKISNNREEKKFLPVNCQELGETGRSSLGRTPVADDLQADLIEINHLQNGVVEACPAIEK